MTSPVIEAMAKAIEEAARKSVPWPDHLGYYGKNAIDGSGIYRPMTLEKFLSETYISDSAHEVFRAASLAAANAVLKALEENITEEMILTGVMALSNSGVDEANTDDAKECFTAMLRAAREE